MIELAYSIVMLFNLTSLFYLLAFIANTTLATISIVFMIATLLYILYHFQISLKFLRYEYIKYVTVILVIWPVMSLCFAEYINLRALGLQVYYFLLVLGSAVFIFVNGVKRFRSIIIFSFLVSLIGFVLNFTNPGIFESLSKYSDTPSMYQGRFYGFFAQPNLAAINIVFLFIGLQLGKTYKIELKQFSCIALTVGGMVMFSGSRTGMILYAASLLLILSCSLQYSKDIKRIYLQQIIKVLLVSLLISIGLLTIMDIIAVNLIGSDFKQLNDRIVGVIQGDLLSQPYADESVILRTYILKDYITKIFQRPFTGYGLAMSDLYYQKGIFSLFSHNYFLTLSFEFGLVYLFFFLFTLKKIYSHRSNFFEQEQMKVNRIFVVIYILCGSISGGLLGNRVSMIIWGCVIGWLAIQDRPIKSTRFNR